MIDEGEELQRLIAAKETREDEQDQHDREMEKADREVELSEFVSERNRRSTR